MSKEIYLWFWLVVFCVCGPASTATGEPAVNLGNQSSLSFDNTTSLRWQRIGRGITEPQIHCIAVNPFDPLHVLAGTSRSAYQSFDGGKIFAPFLYIGATQGRINNIYFEPVPGGCVFIAGDAGLFSQCEAAGSWQEIFTLGDGQSRQCYSVLTDQTNIYLATASGFFYKNKESDSWTQVGLEVRNEPVFFLAQDAQYVYAALASTVYQVHKVTKQVQLFFSLGSKEFIQEDEEFNAEDEDTLYLQQIHSLVPPGKQDPGFYVSTRDGIFMSIDNAKTWQRLGSQGLPFTAITGLIRHEKNRIIAATTRGVFVNLNGYWRQIYNGLDTDRIRGLAADSLGFVYAATDKGVFKLTQRTYSATDALMDYEEFQEFFQNEPTIREVQEMAIRYAEVSPDKIKDWRRQAQQKGWLPSLSLGLDGYKRHTVTDSIWGSHTSGGQHHIGPDNNTHYRNLSWSTRLAWNLGDIVWSTAQTSIDTRSKLVVELRESILNEVTRIYFERRRLQLEMARSPEEGIDYIQNMLRVEELTAFLDALTGGGFSEALIGPGVKIQKIKNTRSY